MVWREGESAFAVTDSQQWNLSKLFKLNEILVKPGEFFKKWNFEVMEYSLLMWLFFIQRRQLFTISYKWTFSSLCQIVILNFHNLLWLLQCLHVWKGWHLLTLNKANYQQLYWIGSMIKGLPSRDQWEWVFEVREVKNKSFHSFSRSAKWKKMLSLFFREVQSEKNAFTLFREVKSEIKMLRDRDREVKVLENS